MFTPISKQALIGFLAALALAGGLGHGLAAHAAFGASQTYTDPTNTYQFSYPSTWQSFQPTGQGWDVAVGSSDQNAVLLSGSITTTDSPGQDAQVVLQTQAQQLGTMQGATTYQTIELNGITVQYGEVLVTSSKDGSVLELQVETYYLNGRLYDLVGWFIPSAQTGQQDALDLQSIFASWTFAASSTNTGGGTGSDGTGGGAIARTFTVPARTYLTGRLYQAAGIINSVASTTVQQERILARRALAGAHPQAPQEIISMSARPTPSRQPAPA
jgi:hypothetical protein